MGVAVRAKADELLGLTTDTLEQLVATHLPRWRIPGFMAGHPVEPDVAADVAFTLAHLHDAGVTEVAGSPVPDAIEQVLAQVDGSRTHTFFSYRVAETLARFGSFDDNQILAGWSPRARADIAAATDSREWIQLLDAGLPRNYAAVLARCEVARERLGLEVDPEVTADLLGRTASMLATDPLGYLDDSTHGVGRTDIYTVDVWLFTEPLADRLGDIWTRGLATAVELVSRTGTPGGCAISWGRSSGALATALTIELAAEVLATDDPALHGGRDLWSARLGPAVASMRRWFESGLVNAHVGRSPYGYRGPFRRLQMTADLLGKLAWAAARLGACRVDPGAEPGDGRGRVVFDHDELLPLGSDPAAHLWSRSVGPTGFVVPFVGATRSDYLAAPRRPGTYEVPVDAAIGCWVPVVHSGAEQYAPAGVPLGVEHAPGRVSARWGALRRLGDLDPPSGGHELPGTAEVTFTEEGRALRVEVMVELATAPHAVAVTVPETSGTPLRVENLDGPREKPFATVDTAGIAEWRSFWGELPVVHQHDLEPDPVEPQLFRSSYRVTPAVRVASTAHGHHYDRTLYGPLEQRRRAVSVANPLGPLGSPDVGADDFDVFHLHWPEWLAFDDLSEHEAIANTLAGMDKPVLWTAHNLRPHARGPGDAHRAVYELWASRADAVVHHSTWGRDRMLATHDFPDDTTHHVVPHPHFGDLYPSARTPRGEAAARLGLPEEGIRIGLLGAPRSERDVQGFLEAVAASTNRDIQVCCWSLAADQEAPRDGRIAVAETYRMVDADTYGLRLAACDVVAMPVDPEGEMLGSGLVADVVGAGLAALCTPWGYTEEILGGAVIPMGFDHGSMVTALDGLDRDTVEASRSAAVDLRERLSPLRCATATEEILLGLLTGSRAERP